MNTNNIKIFHTLLANALIAYVTNFFIRFCLVFWAFLQTNSLIISSLIGWFFALANMLTAINFWNIVDHHKKHTVILRSTIGSAIAYMLGAIIYFTNDSTVFTTIASRQLRLLIVTLMSGTIIGNLRTIALSTTVSLLLPSEEHAKANGKIGTINGVWFTLTSVASGLVIGFLWMGWAIAWAAVIMLLVIGHLMTFSIPEKTIFSAHSDDQQTPSKKLNIRETIATIQEIPWLFALIFFTTFNNFLWWVFMALMDPYGLLLVPVQTRWTMFAVASLAFIAAGIFIAKKWVGTNPLRTIFIVNICMWLTCIYFTIQPSAILIFSGMIIWMFCSPFAEASESTILQKVVPYKKQGRVFGIAQSIESMAMPITALLIGPITQVIFIPLMSEWWRGANMIGSWFGIGEGRWIAVVFTLAGIIGLIVTFIAYKSKYYPLLTKSYLANKNKPAEIDITTPAEVGIN